MGQIQKRANCLFTKGFRFPPAVPPGTKNGLKAIGDAEFGSRNSEWIAESGSAGFRPLPTARLQLFTDSLSTIHYSLFTVHYSLLYTDRSLPRVAIWVATESERQKDFF